MFNIWSWCLLAGLVVSSDAQQLDGPIIMSPNEILLQKGQNYIISCKGTRPLTLKQQELSEEVVGNFTKTQRNVAPSDSDYKYEIELELNDVDQFAVGYYACHDDLVNESDVLRDLVEEPVNTDHISYTYVYVNDSENLIAPMREFVFVKPGSKVVIECKPTFPDIQVNLTMKTEPEGNKKPNIVRHSAKIGYLVRVRKVHTYVCEGHRGSKTSRKSAYMHFRRDPPAMVSIERPRITDHDKREFLPNETISLNCTVNYKSNTATLLEWTIPRGNFKDVEVTSNENETVYGILYRAVKIKNASKLDAGMYTCTAKTKNSDELPKDTINLTYLDRPYLDLQVGNNLKKAVTPVKLFNYLIIVKAYPYPKYRFYKDNNITITNGTKYDITQNFRKNLVLSIKDVDIYDTGNYTIEATNSNITKSLTFELYVKAAPVIQFNMSKERKLVGTEATLKCEVTGYPLPDIRWTFIDDETNTSTNDTDPVNFQVNAYTLVSTLKLQVSTSGTVICSASNNVDPMPRNVARRFIVDEIAGGFGIDGGQTSKWVPEGESVTVTCLASIYDYTSLIWLDPDYNESSPDMVEYSNSLISLVAKLKIDQILLSQAGDYTCVGLNSTNDFERNETITITVAAFSPPNIKVPAADTEVTEAYYKQQVELVCDAEAVPPPEIRWYKNGLLQTDNIESSSNFTTVHSTYKFDQEETTEVEYECVATSRNHERRKSYKVNLQAAQTKTVSPYLSIIGVIIVALIILVVYLTWKIRKEKQFRKELAAAGLLYFKEGATRSLNPDLGIDEQAELLPYDDKFEFPPEKLILGPQLGAGAFGVVYKAEARGIINAEDSTTVAVKMVKKTADNIYIKALASELKIMVHLGKHINIVNLLGACTKNVGKRELIVIVEFCKFGNIHNYMQRHRDVFIDQLTDNKDKTQGNVNQAFSCSGNSGMNSDCLSSNQTQQTDHTFLNTAASNRSGRTDKPKLPSESEKVSETGYVQPEWRTNYESDYVYDGRKPRPLYSRDLLAWAFQIARGMEYLASRKILHGDLAARNILLAEDNVVKICDFGLARSIYKNDEYQKKENSPLPVKWLAVECMTDRIFSTQSDVWSFGIVLWELFSLAKTPYPEISPQNLLSRLLEGHRLEKPPYADDRLYRVMRSCWEQRPTKRPTFSELQETLGSFLEDNVRNHYVELNAPCATMNADRTGEDYLVRVCAPDYNNQITPSPHHYANDANEFFFGVNPSPATPLQHDDEGYLAMTPASNQNIFSPRVTTTTFDFETRNPNSRASAASQGSELTPMLTLNNMSTRSGSDSDREGNASPYLNMYPRIEEETDEVFELETKQNNLKNSQNNAVTNPTYITFSSLDEKAPVIPNNYVNVNANGLVK